jgi:hypothetical protein
MNIEICIGVSLFTRYYYNSVEKLGLYNITPLRTYVDQALVGLLLGDGILIKNSKGEGTYLKFNKIIIHSDYLYFVWVAPIRHPYA